MAVSGGLPVTSELTAAMVIRLGGWDRRYARVLVIVISHNVGLALVDSNGDETNIDVEHYWRDDSGAWEVGSSSGPVGAEIGESGWGEGGRLDRDGNEYVDYVRCAYGRAASTGPQSVTVPEWDQDIEVVATDGGWWAWIEPIQPCPPPAQPPPTPRSRDPRTIRGSVRSPRDTA